ncbi:tRNA U34 5-carboxymethylaminomethyl modifying enzyme MnmG/GidA [Evansella vedderi]|uniref:tRNA U34 5-carboxymethylaminomethyl modifying enzyme MnmG/GidA n=1 Tax=Evansella vedderi TaxID=38282 RepID=A0ABT9ZX26_9BACI|nr:sporulation membrane protein YtrI [Evansella vedderi]MDQ0255038.1 tRNA U34 5-carboxymethylaminomethyl modifying enzyme MnmG/GidA [Evansella vedderi]
MRIPPLYNDKSWQRFFAGFILGMLFGWLFFLYHFGLVHEKLVMEINKQKTTIETQENKIESLQKDQAEKNEQIQKSLTVQDITINFVNEKDVKLSELTLHDIRSNITNELEDLRNKNIETVRNSKELLIKAVENKAFLINSKRFHLKIEQLIIDTSLEINVRIEAAE